MIQEKLFEKFSPITQGKPLENQPLEGEELWVRKLSGKEFAKVLLLQDQVQQVCWAIRYSLVTKEGQQVFDDKTAPLLAEKLDQEIFLSLREEVFQFNRLGKKEKEEDKENFIKTPPADS